MSHGNKTSNTPSWDDLIWATSNDLMQRKKNPNRARNGHPSSPTHRCQIPVKQHPFKPSICFPLGPSMSCTVFLGEKNTCAAFHKFIASFMRPEQLNNWTSELNHLSFNACPAVVLCGCGFSVAGDPSTFGACLCWKNDKCQVLNFHSNPR